MCEVRPALAFEQLLETMFALAEHGNTNKKGMPNPLRLAVIAHFDVVRLPFPPATLQRIGLIAGAAVGRAVGYTVVVTLTLAVAATRLRHGLQPP
jgi:hypothetical protein